MCRGAAVSNNAIFVLIVIAILVVVVIALIVRAQRSKRLESRFGPEYRRAIEETGSKTQAEAKLEKLEKRVEGFKILPLLPEERANFKAKWQTIQARFVDDPKDALTEADRLIQKIMTARGYPVSDFEQRAADISVNYPEIVKRLRSGTRDFGATLTRTGQYRRYATSHDPLPRVVCRTSRGP